MICLVCVRIIGIGWLLILTGIATYCCGLTWRAGVGLQCRFGLSRDGWGACRWVVGWGWGGGGGGGSGGGGVEVFLPCFLPIARVTVGLVVVVRTMH